MSVFRIGGKLHVSAAPGASPPPQPPSWDILDWDCSDEVGWGFNASGSSSHANDGDIETLIAGDAIVDADKILAQKNNIFGTEDYDTLEFKFKTTGLTNYSSDFHMLEIVFYLGNTRAYTFLGLSLDKIRYRHDSGDTRDFGNISPALQNGAWQYARVVIQNSTKNIAVWTSTDNITYVSQGNVTFAGTATKDTFEIGPFESNGGGQIKVELDYVKIASGEWAP